MSVLETIFSQLLRMAAMALPVMAVVLALRFVLRRAPRKYVYALWAIVGFRLVCPVTLSLPVSIFNLRSLESAAGQAASIGGGTFSAVTPTAAPSVVTPPIANTAPLPPTIVEVGGGAAAAVPAASLSALTVASVIWLVGAALLLVWFAAGLLRLRRQVAQAVRQDADVWECDGLPTPFVLGLFRPRIYVPFHLGEEERRYVLAHERCHIRRRDYLVKPLALLILTVYWWNPAVWLCWVLFCRDMEMRCDEAVLEELGDAVKTGYSTSLLSFALDRRIPMALAFGEHDASRRVKHVLDWKRARPAVAFLALSAVVLTVVVCGTNATTRREEEPPAGGSDIPRIEKTETERIEIEEPEIAPEELLGLLPKQYMFASGAGGWRTMLYLNEDGSFTGDYIDMDMGSQEAWGCNFHGRFALPERIAPYFWRMGIEELTVTGLKDGTEVGDTYVEDGTRYTVTEPYGLNNADELLVYLPGISTASLPEGFFNWARGWGWCYPDYYEKGFPAVFPFYGLHNAAADQGWIAVTEDESYAMYVDFRTESITNTASRLYALKDAPLIELAENLACYDVWALATRPERVSTVLDDGEFSVTVTEPSLVTDWDALATLAGNNAALLLALRGELTKADWQVRRDERTVRVTLSREDESWLLPGLEAGRSTFMEYGGTREGLEELIGLLDSGAPRFHTVMTEPFHDILGYDGHIETEAMGFWQMSIYYAETAEGTFPIAESFGFGGGEDHRVDLDGDGQEELVCNVTFGADGARRTYVYQRRADGIYLGTPSIEGLPDHFDWGVNSWWSEYDWDENVFRLHYDVGDRSDGAVLETRGLERMEFQPYNG